MNKERKERLCEDVTTSASLSAEDADFFSSDRANAAIALVTIFTQSFVKIGDERGYGQVAKMPRHQPREHRRRLLLLFDLSELRYLPTENARANILSLYEERECREW